jgi:hypothetical protein
MSQFDWGTMDPYVVDGVELADFLNQWRDALLSLHRGATRPAYVVPGMLWINDSGGASAWILEWYVSPTVGDVPVFTLDTTTGAVAFSASSGGTLTASNLLAQAAANPSVRWNATGNPIDQKAWRATVTAATGALRFSVYNDAGVEQQWLQFNRDGTISSSNAASAALVPGLISGLQTANDGTTPLTVLDINKGSCSDNLNGAMLNLPAQLRKSINVAWAAGTGAGGMGPGLAVAANTWYHVIATAIAGAVDVFFDTDPLASHKPAGAGVFRRLWSIKTNASSQIIPYLQIGDLGLWLTAIRDISNMNLSATSPINVRMSVPPLPVMVQGRMNASNASGPFFIDVLTPGTTGQNNGVIGVPSGQQGSAFFSVMSDALGQLRYVTGGGTTNTIYVDTYGWIDTRGRFD